MAKKPLKTRVAIIMSDIQRTLYEGESCFDKDPEEMSRFDGRLDVEEAQGCFLRLAEKVIKIVKDDMRKSYWKTCTCKTPMRERSVNSGVVQCCECGGVDFSEM